MLPLLLIIVFGGSSKKGDTLMYFVIGLAIFGGIYSIISFFKYFFYIRDDKLIVQKGVFKRSTLAVSYTHLTLPTTPYV